MEIPEGTDPEQSRAVSAEASLPGKEPPADDIVDEVIAASFPASDPPQWWAGPPN